MSEQLPKIYIVMKPAGPHDHDVASYAMAEDGHKLASYWSSSAGWARHDIGLTSNSKHDNYKEHYPDGYELVEVEDLTDAGYMAALEKNQALRKAHEESEEPFAVIEIQDKEESDD